MLYLRDRPMLAYHYMKVDKEALAKAPLDVEPTPTELEARRRFYAAYGLPEHMGEQLHPLAIQDLATVPLLPRWVLGQLSADEIAQMKAVKKDGRNSQQWASRCLVRGRNRATKRQILPAN